MNIPFEKLNEHERLVLIMTYLMNIEKNSDYFFSEKGKVFMEGLINSARNHEELNAIECAFYILEHSYGLL